MADSAVTVARESGFTPRRSDGIIRDYFRVTVGAGDYATGGLTIDLSTLKTPGVGTKAPLLVNLRGQAGFVYEYDFGTTNANGKILFRVNNTTGVNNPFPQHSVTATVAGITGDEIRGEVIYVA